jgi:thiol-disulfide isomerase/thioredoxin
MKQLSIIVLFALLTGCAGRDPHPTGKEGKPVPEYVLQMVDSTTYLSTKDIPAGKPVVFFYLGTHCPYSHNQMKEIVENADRLEDIRIYALTTAPYEEMKAFYNEYELDQYPNITMGRDTANFFAPYYATPGFPFLAIYDKEKNMHEAFIGEVKGWQIEKSAEWHK